MGEMLTGMRGGGKKPYEDIWLEGIQASTGYQVELRHSFPTSGPHVVGAALLEAYTDSNVTKYDSQNTVLLVNTTSRKIEAVICAKEVNGSYSFSNVRFKVKIRVFLADAPDYHASGSFGGLRAFLQDHIIYDTTQF